jgi:peroxiredoxin
MAVEPGDVAPEVDLPADSGDRWQLSQQRGQSVVLIFHRHLA